jgi:hypothetical protein
MIHNKADAEQVEKNSFNDGDDEEEENNVNATRLSQATQTQQSI